MAAVSLKEILGQRSALATLRAVLTSGRVHHAWVFQGPAGVGKRTTAEAFAATLLDPTTGPTLSGDIEPEEGSETARLIAAGVHPDLHIITKELARYSDDRAIRERKLISIPKEVVEEHLLEPASLAASIRSGAQAGKVFIVDEAELLNLPTQNALLKTLEEPAEGTVIILVTSAPELLLPTMRSRCQRVSFEPLDADSMSKWLKRWESERGAKVDAKSAKWALEFAAGSPGVAVTALEGDFHRWAEELAPMLESSDRGEFAPDLGGAMAKLVDEWAKGWVDKNKNASKDAANKAGAAHMFALLAERARRQLRSSRAADVQHGLRTIDLVAAAERELDANVNLALVMENVAAQAARAPAPR